MATAWLFWVLSGQAKSLERGEFELGSERQDGASHAKIKIRVNCSGKRNSQCKGPEVGPAWCVGRNSTEARAAGAERAMGR